VSDITPGYIIPTKPWVFVHSIRRCHEFFKLLHNDAVKWKGLCEAVPRNEASIKEQEEQIDKKTGRWPVGHKPPVMIRLYRSRLNDIQRICGLYDSFILDWKSKRAASKDSIVITLAEAHSEAVVAHEKYRTRLLNCWPTVIAALKISISHLQSIHLPALVKGQNIDAHRNSIKDESQELLSIINRLTSFKNNTGLWFATDKLPRLIKLLETGAWAKALDEIDMVIVIPLNENLDVQKIPEIRPV